MVEKVIGIGNKVEIERINPDTNEKRLYKSQVFEIMDNDDIRIAMPFEGNKLVLLALNVRYKMYFYTPSGLFECMGFVVDRFKSDNQYVAGVSLKTGLKKIQRREFYRLEKLIDIEYRLLSDEEAVCAGVEELASMEDAAILPPMYKKGVTVDLSGGGARLLLDSIYPIASFLSIKLKISVETGSSEFWAIGRIVMSEKVVGTTDQYINRVEFVRIRESRREKLIRYIFNEERHMRR